jgi:DNA primase
MALAAALQYPQHMPSAFDELGDDAFAVPAWQAVHAGIRAAGGVAVGRTLGPAAWVAAVGEQAGAAVEGLVDEIAVSPLPEDRADYIPAFVAGVYQGVADLGLTRHIADARSRVQRLDPSGDFAAYQKASAELLALEAQRRVLRESQAG